MLIMAGVPDVVSFLPGAPVNYEVPVLVEIFEWPKRSDISFACTPLLISRVHSYGEDRGI